MQPAVLRVLELRDFVVYDGFVSNSSGVPEIMWS